jgi:hypothetical protein
MGKPISKINFGWRRKQVADDEMDTKKLRSPLARFIVVSLGGPYQYFPRPFGKAAAVDNAGNFPVVGVGEADADYSPMAIGGRLYRGTHDLIIMAKIIRRSTNRRGTHGRQENARRQKLTHSPRRFLRDQLGER